MRASFRVFAKTIPLTMKKPFASNLEETAMSNWALYVQAKQQDMMRDAEHERLASQAARTPSLPARALAALGAWMVQEGERLETRYQPEPAFRPQLQIKGTEP
jgi:hypothetical protein